MIPVTFEEEGHIYRLDGEVVPSVTQIIERRYPHFARPDDAETSKLGTDIALAISRLFKKEIGLEDIEPRLFAPVGVLLNWQRLTGFVVDYSEVPLASRWYRFAGRFDILGHTANGRIAILEVKSGAVSKAKVGLQTAAQKILIEDDGNYGFKGVDRYAIGGLKSGRAQIVKLDNPFDVVEFLELVNNN